MNSPVDPSTTPTARTPTLVGREREQTVLRQALDAMLAGHGLLVLVSGEAGIGKTTLIEWLGSEAETEGCRVLKGGCYDLTTTPPYGPWIELIYAEASTADETSLPSFLRNRSDFEDVGSQETLFSLMAEYFLHLSAVDPVILILEDLHWADPGSIDFLRVFARRVTNHRLLLLATHRSDDLERRHPLYVALPSIVRETNAERIQIRPLDNEACRALIRGRFMMSTTDESRLEAFLLARSEGNPLFAEELLRTLEEARILRLDGDLWYLDSLSDVKVPPLLNQVIEGRLARMTEQTRSRLQVAAVIGQRIPLSLWQTVTQSGDESMIAAIEEGVVAQIIEEVAGGTSYQFQHALFQQALYDEMIALRRRGWHRRIAEGLLVLPNPDPDQLAYHLQQAEDSRAAAWLIKAGERAERAYLWTTAVDRFEAAFSRLTEQGASASERAVLLFHIAHLQRLLDGPRSIETMEKAERAADAAGETALAIYSRHLSGDIRCTLGDPAPGIATIKQAANDFRALSADERARLSSLLNDNVGPLEASLIFWLGVVGPLDEAIAIGTRLIAEMPENVSFGLRGGQGYTACRFRLGMAYGLTGQPWLARQSFEQAKEYYRSMQHHFMMGTACFHELHLVQLPYFADDLSGRTRLVTEGRNALHKARNVTVVQPDVAVIYEQMISGEWDAARDAVEALQADPLTSAVCSPVRAYLALHSGDVDRSTQTVADVLTQGISTEPGHAYLPYALALQRIAAGIALADQNVVDARGWLEAHDRWLDWSGAVLGRAEGSLLWAQYHLASGDQRKARRHVDQALALASEPWQPLALIAIHRFLGQIDMVDQRFIDAEQHLQESLRWAEACAAPFERALTLLETAELRFAQRRTNEADALLDEVQAICEPLEAQPTLERVEVLRHRVSLASKKTLNYPGGLSPREVEVLRLVAEGLTDAEIADNLFVSRRTVNSHLANIFNKLGVNARAAAVAAAARNGLL
jgi:DNA-binding CsgD family transcriptional regulator